MHDLRRPQRAAHDRIAGGNAPGAGCALGSPIENTSEPPTGWPSAEITRQLSTCVPRRRRGGVTMTVVFSAVDRRARSTSPPGR